jgi:hypothetical protein
MDERFVDKETGEILTPKTVLLRSNEFVKVVSRQNGRSIKFIKIRSSHKVKRRILALPNDEAAFLFKAALYATEGYNYLMGDNERGTKNVPLTIKDLAKITKYSYSTARRLVKSLVEKKVLKTATLNDGRKVLAVNPLYVVNGRRPEPELLQLFSAEIQEAGERVDG